MYRYKQSSGKDFLQTVKIPPMKAALEQHVKRAVYQGGYGWGH